MSFAECRFGGCDAPAGHAETVCFNHYIDFKAGALDSCPGCRLLKPRSSDRCPDCAARAAGRARNHDSPSRLASRVADIPGVHDRLHEQQAIREFRGRYDPESSDTWDRGDESATIFYAYILKMDGGEFYCGHTRDLRARLSEHRDGNSRSTAGQHPVLVWFTELPTRAEAAGLEAALKELNDRNPREIRKMVIRFKDLVREMSDG
jgi:predicted GIY-YIG superfamily endonuclease